MGVVTCGKEMKLVRSPGSYFKKYYGGIPSEQKEFYETYISTTSPQKKISSWLSQTHANSKRSESAGKPQGKGPQEAFRF